MFCTFNPSKSVKYFKQHAIVFNVASAICWIISLTNNRVYSTQLNYIILQCLAGYIGTSAEHACSW